MYKRQGTDTLLGYLQLKPIGIKGSHPHFFFFDGHTPGCSQIQVVEQEAQDNRQEQVVDPLHGPPDAAAGEKSLAPVSYTHLDVYKRQPRTLIKFAKNS